MTKILKKMLTGLILYCVLPVYLTASNEYKYTSITNEWGDVEGFYFDWREAQKLTEELYFLRQNNELTKDLILQISNQNSIDLVIEKTDKKIQRKKTAKIIFITAIISGAVHSIISSYLTTQVISILK